MRVAVFSKQFTFKANWEARLRPPGLFFETKILCGSSLHFCIPGSLEAIVTVHIGVTIGANI